MPVIVFASSKGGATKTTSCIVLACELARQGREKGLNIALVDADPNQHTAGWAMLSGRPANIEVFPNVIGETIFDVVEDAKTRNAFVLIDLDGVSSVTVTYAIDQADLVLISCQASQNDAIEAVKTIKAIRKRERMIKRSIPHSILFGRTNAAIFSENTKHIYREFENAGIEILSASMVDREAYKSIFSFGGTINNLDASTKKDKLSLEMAEANAVEIAEAVKKKLKSIIKSKQSEINEMKA